MLGTRTFEMDATGERTGPESGLVDPRYVGKPATSKTSFRSTAVLAAV
jgi:hypothetical protein